MLMTLWEFCNRIVSSIQKFEHHCHRSCNIICMSCAKENTLHEFSFLLLTEMLQSCQEIDFQSSIAPEVYLLQARLRLAFLLLE